ncbi:restriction endonuclease subunit S [Fusobacterium periodonticum]|uniref:Type I restriction modification DNA specificity family protein n=1 Tax=Fusobacterium periodonticum 1_1_41FAA TaxID=469621 RepID=D6LG55_9FUSO|nr:restriction endonuclease subunit S [Fusobacterium periodonticum]EFG29140.1 type I restriction modification DNA specificity domain protein [Fusobacterium periodonticum 1_1_41FAA]
MRYILKELIKIKNGKDYKTCKLGSIPVYGTGGIINYVGEFLYNDESILLPRKGSLSNIRYVNQPFWTVDTMYWTCVNKELVLPKYLYFYLKLLDLSSRDSGSTLPSMTFDAYYELEVEIPRIKKQKKILDLLNPIEEKIMINNKINDNLFSQISIIYNYWFTQYEFPNTNGKSYKSNNGELYYNNIVKKDIPKNWVVETLASNSLSEIIKPGVDLFEEKIYYTTADIVNKNITNGSIVSYNTKEDRANMQPIPYSVWFAKMKNTIKHLFLAPNMKFIIENSILSTGLCGLKCKEIAFEYISSYILHPYFENHKDVLSHGATQEAVNNDDLNYIYIIVPEEKILRQYHNLTKSIFKKIAENMCENKELITIRDFLLPLLMNGQATISE